MAPVPDLTATGLRSTFDSVEPLTVGVEEEVMLLDPETLDLAPDAEELLELLEGDPRFKRELPRAQLEIATRPTATVREAIEELARGRIELAAAAGERWRLAAAGLHPFAAAEGPLSDSPDYADTRNRFGRVARQQLVFALQVHVSVGGAERTLAVYNALRSYLPEISALAANSRWYEGRDSEFATMRPMIGQRLPRQGVPPLLHSWDEYAEALRWGASSGFFDAGSWWWEMRPHPAFGTLEVRVPDAQAAIEDAEGVAAFVHGLVVRLMRMYDAGEPLAAAPRWRIEENRWSAARDGLEAELADVDTGEREPVRERIGRLIASPPAPLAALLECNGAERQRRVGEAGGAEPVAEELVRRFPPAPGG